MISIRNITFLALAFMVVAPFSEAQDGNWRHWGGDGANTKYSPLDQITRDNFDDLEIAWSWESIDEKRCKKTGRSWCK